MSYTFNSIFDTTFYCTISKDIFNSVHIQLLLVDKLFMSIVYQKSRIWRALTIILSEIYSNQDHVHPLLEFDCLGFELGIQ